MGDKKPLQRGSSTSDKEIAYSVRKGQKVTFHPSHAAPISGYVCGMDDFHWKVVKPEGDAVYLVHKSASVVEIHESPEYADEEDHDNLERVVAPFREYVMKSYFSNGSDPAPTRQNRKPDSS